MLRFVPQGIFPFILILLSQPPMLNVRHPYPHDENIPAYGSGRSGSLDRMNAPHTMRPSNDVRTWNISSIISIIALLKLT